MEEEEEEEGSQFNIEITVTEPRKMGDGMNAYMAYRVNTKVSKMAWTLTWPTGWPQS